MQNPSKFSVGNKFHAKLAKIRPRLLVLDPLVRLHRGDENSSAEISELLVYPRTALPVGAVTSATVGTG